MTIQTTKNAKVWESSDGQDRLTIRPIFHPIVSSIDFIDLMDELGQNHDRSIDGMKPLSLRLQRYIVTLGAFKNDRLVGTATYWFEPKFLHGGSWVCHIDDVAVLGKYQEQGIGTKLVEYCVEQAKEMKCYKVVLTCSNANLDFYKERGFSPHENAMRMDLQ